ncbi:MAG: pentapeptide repeat-containing protein, partial [Pseudanabaena sp.]
MSSTIRSNPNRLPPLTELNKERRITGTPNFYTATTLIMLNLSKPLFGKILTIIAIATASPSLADPSSDRIQTANRQRLIETNRCQGCNLQNTDLSGLKLIGANLNKANLQGANLRSVDLRGSNLQEAVLIQSDLSYADLRLTNFAKANLQGANLSNTHLLDASFVQSNLQEANLTDSYG